MAVSGVGTSPALATCETSSTCGGVRWFSRGTPLSPHLPIGSSGYERNNLERDVKLNQKKKDAHF